MTLYEIDNQLRECLEQLMVDEETGEITADANYAQLQELTIERDAKLEGIGVYLKELDAETTALKEEIAVLKARYDAKVRKKDGLKNFLSGYLTGNSIAKFETSKVRLSFRKSEAVEAEEDKVPKKYFKKVVDYKLDKAGIKELLKKGIKVKGCMLVEKQNLQIK